jgi:hypothetical protein
MPTLCPSHLTAADLYRHPPAASADVGGIGVGDVGGGIATCRARVASASPRRTPAGHRHGNDSPGQAKRDGGHSTSASLTMCPRGGPHGSQPCWQPHCRAAISPARGAVKPAVTSLCLPGPVLPPQPKGPGLPQPIVPDSCPRSGPRRCGCRWGSRGRAAAGSS